jgi:hypothetical protein
VLRLLVVPGGGVLVGVFRAPEGTQAQ